jgi:phosphohistidine phosphatase
MLLRHAKAEPSEAGRADNDRALAKRGKRDAALMGKAMAGGPLPDLILCSPSRRTRETMAALIEPFAAEPRIVIADGLYGPGAATYVDTIGALGGEAQRLLVIGHNPAIHATALALAGSSDAGLVAKFPTCALAIIAFDVPSWSDLRPGEGRLVSFRRPRDLGAHDADD